MNHEQAPIDLVLTLSEEEILQKGGSRPARPGDAQQIFTALKELSLSSGVLPRTREEVEAMCSVSPDDRLASRFFVFAVGEQVVAGASVDIYDEIFMEIRSVFSRRKPISRQDAHDPKAKLHMGAEATQSALDYALTFQNAEIFLTTDREDFFTQFGFQKDKNGDLVVYKNRQSIVPEDCIDCPSAHALGQLCEPTEDDIPEMMELQEEEVHSGTIQEWTEEKIRDSLPHFLVLRDQKGSIIAMAALVPHGPRIAEICHLIVRKHMRRQGAGSLIMRGINTKMRESCVGQALMTIRKKKTNFSEKNQLETDTIGGKVILWYAAPTADR